MADALDGHTLLVVGYSASDDLDVVLALMEVAPSRVVWIDHAGGRVRAGPTDRTFTTGIEAARIASRRGVARRHWRRRLRSIMPIGVGMDDEPIGWHVCARAAAGSGDLEAGLGYLKRAEATIGGITEDHRGEVLADRAVSLLGGQW